MKKSRIGAWILIVALLMQNIPLSVWASGEQGTSYFGAGQSTEGDAAKASSGDCWNYWIWISWEIGS